MYFFTIYFVCINKVIMDDEVQCTSHWKKVGNKSWRGFVYLTTEEEKPVETQTYSWYNPYYWWS